MCDGLRPLHYYQTLPTWLVSLGTNLMPWGSNAEPSIEIYHVVTFIAGHGSRTFFWAGSESAQPRTYLFYMKKERLSPLSDFSSVY